MYQERALCSDGARRKDDLEMATRVRIPSLPACSLSSLFYNLALLSFAWPKLIWLLVAASNKIFISALWGWKKRRKSRGGLVIAAAPVSMAAA